MSIEYTLRIKSDKISELNKVLDAPATSTKYGWEMSVDGDVITFPQATDYFARLLERRWALLSNLGITADDVAIWILYEYEQQCNLEFAPAEMRKLTDIGVTLCISCWETGSEITLA